VFCDPYDDVFEILRSQYGFAVEHLQDEPPFSSLGRNPNERLGEHLLAYYIRGKIELNDPLMKGFWETATETVRAYALDSVGRALYHSSEFHAIGRATALWEFRLKSGHAREMATFGRWFASGKFPDSWSVAMLLAALKVAKRVQFDDLIVKRLVSVSQTLPLECIKCLQAMVEGDDQGWTVLAWNMEARIILENALGSKTEEVVTSAENLVHYLGTRGYLEFRDLIERKRS